MKETMPTWCFLLLAACSSAPATMDAGVQADAGPAPDAQLDAPVRSAKCADQDQKLQAALDGARKSPNAMLAVKNEACGTSVYVSGDMQTANPDALWRIGSVTKTYVSAAILSLVKDGKLALDEKLEKWVPGVPNTTGVTIAMLLDHRSGIFNYTEDPQFLDNRDKPWTPKQIVDLATMHAPYFAPDADYHYSNTNYVLLGMILEAATSMKAGAVLRQRTYAPAKLSATFLDGEDTIEQSRMARGFFGNKDVTFFIHPSGPWTAGAMVASGAEMVEWVTALYGSDAILDPTTRALLTSKTSNLGSAKYGLGVIVLDSSVTLGAGEAWGHNGSIDGFVSQAFYFPEKKTALAAVVNKNGVNPNDIMAAALATLFP